ncbi:MAG: L,D-transpeptidase family protein [bacterium]
MKEGKTPQYKTEKAETLRKLLEKIENCKRILEENRIKREALLKELAELEKDTKEPNYEVTETKVVPENKKRGKEAKKEKAPEPQKIIEQKQEEKLVKSLSKNELKITKEEMKKTVLLPFEPQKTRTDVGLFLRNQMVKFASGFNISEQMKKIAKKMRKGILLGTGICVLWPATLGGEGKISYVLPDDVKGKVTSISYELQKKNIPEQLSKKNFSLETYKKLPTNAKNIYLYAINLASDYVIIDKPTATMYVIGQDKKLRGSFPVLLGKTKGEMPNKADPDSDDAGAQATTPAGKYKLSYKKIATSDFLEYKGKIFSIYGSDDLGLHMTYPKEHKKRTEALNTPTTDDNRMTYGCINVSEENFQKYLISINENALLFITPDNENLSLNPETGKVEGQGLT